MTLSLYIARRFGWMVAQVFAIFFGILMLIDVIEQLRRFSDRDIGLAGAARLSLMNVPESLYRILPLILVIAAVAMFVGLARSSELVVIRAAGRSGLRFLMAPVTTALALGALAVAVLNPIVAATTREYDRLLAIAQGGSVLSISAEGLWLRQGDEDGQTVIRAARANAEGTVLYGASFVTFDAGGVPVQRTEAAEATLEPGAWVLTGARQWDLTAANPALTAGAGQDGLRLPSDLTAETIRDSFGAAHAIPIWELPAFIAGLERAGFSARAYRVWLQMELALPVLLAAMVLIAAGFTMRHTRGGGTGRMVMLALAAGFFIFFLRNFAQVLGENGQIPVALAAWTPPVAAAMMALGLLLHLEDG
jgi:lipopolysaccharide export system permease protein